MYIAIIFVFILNFKGSKEDLPVHCLAQQIEGDWIFYLGPSQLSYQKCGHQSPDSNNDHIFSNPQSEFRHIKTFHLTLNLPNKVLYNTTDDILQGDSSWTMVYDEGFQVIVGFTTFFAFSKYTHVGNQKPLNSDDSLSDGYVSNCDQTFVGWYNSPLLENSGTGVRTWGCFYGIQLPPSKPFVSQYSNIFIQTSDQKINNKFMMSQLENEQLSPNIILGKDFSKLSLSDYVKLTQSYNNSNNERWSSNQQINQKSQSESQIDQILQVEKLQLMQNFLQMQNKEKQQTHVFSQRKLRNSNEQQLFMNNLRNKHYTQKISKQQQICTELYQNGLPKCFDWRNVGGINYDTEILKQGSCGSCYGLAAKQVYESRVKIKTRNQVTPQLSLSSLIYCTGYNQGCNGGYPFLSAKIGLELGFYEQKCVHDQQRGNKYNLFSKEHKHERNCNWNCYNNPNYKVWKVKEYGYIGPNKNNQYGQSSEPLMMQEIIQNGPIMVAFDASNDLYYYQSGIYRSHKYSSDGTSEASSENINHKFPKFDHKEKQQEPKWIFTNHAVVCVGWGEEYIGNGISLKFWILKNSWGTDWGEKGYFRYIRGVNLGGIENQATYLIPDIQW